MFLKLPFPPLTSSALHALTLPGFLLHGVPSQDMLSCLL